MPVQHFSLALTSEEGTAPITSEQLQTILFAALDRREARITEGLPRVLVCIGEAEGDTTYAVDGRIMLTLIDARDTGQNLDAEAAERHVTHVVEIGGRAASMELGQANAREMLTRYEGDPEAGPGFSR
jgi:pyrrolidone-carboxylate peptidase